MNRKIWTAVTIVIVAASALLLSKRMGWLRGGTLATRIALRTSHEPSSAAFAPVEDWPQWRGPRGDGVSRENVGQSWPKEGLERLWEADIGLGFSSPVAVNGRVYVFSLNNGKDNLACFDAVNGTVLWSDDASSGWTKEYEGTRATPTIAGDAIFTYGGLGELICRDLVTGKPRWKQAAVTAAGGSGVQSWGSASTPLVADGRVYVQAGGGGSILIGFDIASGSVAFKSEATGDASYSHPIQVDVAGSKQLVVFAADAIYGINPANGSTIWKEAWNTSYGVNASTPVYRDGYLYCSSAYGMGGLMLRLSPTGAEKSWEKKDIKSKFQGLVLDGDSLYGNSDPGTLYCISWPEGKRKWKAGDSDVTLGVGGSFVKAPDDKMVLMSETGTLSLTKVSADGITLISQFEAFEGGSQIWSTPLIYGGRIYAEGTKELVCFKLP